MKNKTEKIKSSKYYLLNMQSWANMYADPECKLSGKTIFENYQLNQQLYLQALKEENDVHIQR